jgi:O-antigen biosynthesis protein WbqP
MYPFFKRLFDLAASFLGLFVLAPVFLVLIFAIKISSPGPVFFRQKRIGRNKRFFYMLKFRTMRTDAPHDVPTHLLQNPYAYITPIGRFLRKTSLDELPQLFHILRGDMSVVGPRPALWNQDDLAAERDKYGANDVRPGLTGLAQIKGRDELPIDVKAAYDGEYVEKMGLLFDFRILLLTVFSVTKGEGVKEGGDNL